ncbi:MAG TPA: OB-fold nucleic acid binding domain-containing protein, partial [Candidatus Binatia bacterium]
MVEKAPIPSEDSSEQVEVRKQKLEKLKAAGGSVYPNDFKPSHSAPALVAEFTAANDEELGAAPRDIRIAGRIMAIRRMGKASFFHLQDRRARLQVYIQLNTV